MKDNEISFSLVYPEQNVHDSNQKWPMTGIHRTSLANRAELCLCT